jgi:hypothetical protein
MAYEALLIAEGSDWCWWYGPEHDSANRPEFDQLYRSHLANVYRFLNLTPPEELSRPILRISTLDVRVPPTGAIHPTIDGEVTSYFEWMGAGVYRVDERSGSMHGKKVLVSEVLFGSDGQNFYVRVDFCSGTQPELSGMEVRITLQSLDNAPPQSVTIRLGPGAATSGDLVECAFLRILEVRFPLAAVAVTPGSGLRFQLSLWHGGLPVDTVPHQGWLEMATTSPVEMAA